jgi:YegS/Rv2252/BmrU family lipid kinase
MKKLMLIINPAAGKGEYKESVADILETFCDAGYSVTVMMTTKRGDAEGYARDLGSGFDMLVCCGGDGTLSEVTSGLMQTDKRPTIGYIPMGTANDVASSLKLSKIPQRAAEDIVENDVHPMDIGIFNGEKFFTYVAAFGAFTQVSYETPQEVKQSLGHFAYVLEGAGSISSITPKHAVVEYDDGVIEGDFLYGGVTNSTSVAGLVKLDPDSVGLGDGLFEVMLVKNPNSLSKLNRIFHNILTRKYDPDYVVFLHTKKVKFTFDEPVAWTRDGEDGGEHTVVEAVNSHEAVNIIY